MLKPSSFARKLLAPAMLLLTGIFLQSCSEEVPILMPRSGTNSTANGTVSSNSTITLTISNKAYTITNKDPNYILFVTTPVIASKPLYRQYSIFGTSGSQSNTLDYDAIFHTDTTGNNKFILDASTLNFNQKKYTTIGVYGSNKFIVNKLDVNSNTTNGSFGYYLYDSVYLPTDSIYVSGTFNIVK